MRAVYGLIIALGLLLSGCADAGKDQSVESGATVLLNGSGSTPDAYGEIRQYQWDQIEGQQVALSDNKSVKPTFTAPIVTEEETLVFRLTTIEQGGYVSPSETSDTVSITVTPPSSFNAPPTASAEVNLTSIKYGESVTFSASGSTDSDGEIVSYEWRDENNITLSAETEFVHTFATAGVHVIALIVTDDGGKIATESISVTVHELQKPIAVINSSTDTVLIDGNVTFDANGSNDVDGAIVSYRWLDDTNTVLSHEKSCTHTFATKGEHNITLIVTDDDGQEGVAKASIMAEALLLSISLEADITSLEINETATLTATGHYNDNTTEDVSSNAEWVIDDNSSVSIDTDGILTALQSGSTTIMAKIGDVKSNMISIEINEPVLLESLSISPNPIEIRIGQSTQIVVEGYYNDGSRKVIEEGLYFTVENPDLINLDSSGTLEGLQEGFTTFTANVGTIVSPVVNVSIRNELDTSNFNFTNFGNRYLNQIPSNSTKESYDENRFCMIAGAIYAEDGSPLSGVKVSIHKHPEYGTTMTNSEGIYTIPAEGGLQLTMRYQKEGYTTIDRKIQAPVQDWIRTEDVTMLQKDSKVTTINLADPAPQTHISTPVTDDRGTRSTTLVFDGVTKATVTSPDGTTRELTNIDVRATEFNTPESMPAVLPKESAYTYCSDLEIDGVKDDEEVNFDAPVVMYVENFLEFEAGEIVPVGYYDRNQGKWIGSDNGAVITLLDTDNDGQIDALDSTGDGQANDLNGDGSLSDEVAGIQNNPNYVAGNTYWRAAFTHFTPWDYNWPYGPPEDAEEPDQEEPTIDEEPPNDCQIDVSSYVTKKSRVFHEDIPLSGTDITLHYASNRVQGYIHSINVSVDTSNLPASVQGAEVTLSIAGKTYTQTPDLSELGELKFVWDGTDVLEKRVTGTTRATITVSYVYQFVYYSGSRSFSQAWARAGDSLTEIRGRSTLVMSNTKTIKLNAETKANMGNGWRLSSHDAALDNAIIRGNGSVEKNSMLAGGIITTVAGNGGRAYSGDGGSATKASFNSTLGVTVDSLGNLYIVDFNRIRKVDTSGVITTVAGNGTSGFSGDGGSATEASLYYPTGVTVDRLGNLYIADRYNNRIRKVDTSGVITTVAGNGASGFSGDGGSATEASLGEPTSVTVDSLGNLYIADLHNHRIRKVDASGVITTVAGYGIRTYSGDGGSATEASLNYPYGTTIDNLGNLYIADSGNYRIRKVSISPLFQSYNLNLNQLMFINRNNTADIFSSQGIHLKTIDLNTGNTLQEFVYDESNYLTTITDQFGEVTTIARDIEGNPTQITAPNGQKTYLSVDEQGNLIEVRYEDNSNLYIHLF